MHNLNHFLTAQQTAYPQALQEIKNGRKTSHWIWYIFPQIAGLGTSGMSQKYALSGLPEAQEYIDHVTLGKRLIEISNALLQVKHKTATEILGSPDDMKVRSCITLFGQTKNADPVFNDLLLKYYNGKPDERTLQFLEKNNR